MRVSNISIGEKAYEMTEKWEYDLKKSVPWQAKETSIHWKVINSHDKTTLFISYELKDICRGRRFGDFASIIDYTTIGFAWKVVQLNENILRHLKGG